MRDAFPGVDGGFDVVDASLNCLARPAGLLAGVGGAHCLVGLEQRLQGLELPFTAYGATVQVRAGRAITIAASPAEAAAVVAVDLETGVVEDPPGELRDLDATD